MEQGAEVRGSFSLVAEESSRNEQEVDQEIKRDGRMAEAHSCSREGSLVKMQVGFAEGAQIESA